MVDSKQLHLCTDGMFGATTTLGQLLLFFGIVLIHLSFEGGCYLRCGFYSNVYCILLYMNGLKTSTHTCQY